jgi:phospholipase/carboxylesterase
MKNPTFIHRYIPGANADSPVLLLLHGTGGNEEDLIPLGQQLLPGAAILSLRGRVSENGMPRFFRRFAEGVFDLEDLRLQTDALAEFITAAREEYGLSQNKVIAVGYSNGANIASSLMLRHPEHLVGAVLLRAMVPFRPDRAPDLSPASVFIGSGERDPIVPRSNAEELAGIFRSAGAQVTTHWYKGGHELSRGDLEAAKAWLTQLKPSAEQIAV